MPLESGVGKLSHCYQAYSDSSTTVSPEGVSYNHMRGKQDIKVDK